MSSLAQHERDFLIQRIINGSTLVSNGSSRFFIRNPDGLVAYKAQIVYEDTLQRSRYSGVMSEDDLLDWMYETGFWSDEKEQQLKGIGEDVDKLKIGLYESSYRSEQRKKIRSTLQSAKFHLARLSNERHSFDHVSDTGVALIAKISYLFSKSVFSFDMEPIIEEGMECDFAALFNEYNASAITEAQFRDLVQNEPWRSIWTASCGSNPFGTPPAQQTQEQKAIVFWSVLYDNIAQSMDAPHDSVMDDNDMVDGWLLIQKRKREADQLKKEGDEIIGRHGKSDDIFVVVDSEEDARRIAKLNNASANTTKAMRLKAVREKGSLKEHELPDRQRDIQIQYNQELTRRLKGGQ